MHKEGSSRFLRVRALGGEEFMILAAGFCRSPGV
jgi:hypothetical protein